MLIGRELMESAIGCPPKGILHSFEKDEEALSELMWSDVHPENIFKEEMQGAAYVYYDIFGISSKVRLHGLIRTNMYYICIKKYCT